MPFDCLDPPIYSRPTAIVILYSNIHSYDRAIVHVGHMHATFYGAFILSEIVKIWIWIRVNFFSLRPEIFFPVRSRMTNHFFCMLQLHSYIDTKLKTNIVVKVVNKKENWVLIGVFTQCASE